jgi:hypothetical protein
MHRFPDYQKLIPNVTSGRVSFRVFNSFHSGKGATECPSSFLQHFSLQGQAGRLLFTEQDSFVEVFCTHFFLDQLKASN